MLTLNVKRANFVRYDDLEAALHAFTLALERGEVEVLPE